MKYRFYRNWIHFESCWLSSLAYSFFVPIHSSKHGCNCLCLFAPTESFSLVSCFRNIQCTRYWFFQLEFRIYHCFVVSWSPGHHTSLQANGISRRFYTCLAVWSYFLISFLSVWAAPTTPRYTMTKSTSIIFILLFSLVFRLERQVRVCMFVCSPVNHTFHIHNCNTLGSN